MRQERKVVTVLFCDLVGFTSQAEEMDPEDVAALLGPYHARLKEELERYGGTVEKFIGDAVMALFGAPVALEDDAERAVRAALAISDFAAEQEIELRIGITTGEALVNLDARPDAGETMATGDVVNTAARLQSAAPVNGVLVSRKTYEATSEAIEYREAEPVEAKGKTKPVPVWQAVFAAPLQERAHTTPLVGRERELAKLREALARTIEERAPQLVTLVGEPGIGKSRLVHELSRADGGFAWRKGRCLPYGDGVAFWALGEIVKAELGILESDSPEKAEAKLDKAVDDAWVAAHLRTLIGIGEERESLGDRRAEAFAAWRRYLTTLAEEQALALVLEDIHWADDGLLDFVTHLVEWAQESLLLVICTARPELLERRPAWSTTVTLAPLSDDETGRLLSTLTPGAASDDLVARAAGNPLYAEQYARLLAEGGSPDELPTTVQGIVTARLDGLVAEEKALVQDAAVIGEVFWSGAVAALAKHDRWSVEERLLALERRDLVRRRRASSVEEETEYGFVHIVVRDVAYGEIPRTERADKHFLAAQWIESLGRPDDQAELIAHHYLSALELAEAAGLETEELGEQCCRALRHAGDRALGLNAFDTALRFYRRAVDLTSPTAPDRPRLLFLYGKAWYFAEEAGTDVLADARDALLEIGERELAAEAEVMLGDIFWRQLDRERGARHLAHALSLLADTPPSRSKAYVLATVSRVHMIASEADEAIRVGTEALRMAEALQLPDVRAFVLNNIGAARVLGGDPGGLADLEQSIAIAEEIDDPWHIVRGYGNLGGMLTALGELGRGSVIHDKAAELRDNFGVGFGLRFLPAEQAMNRYHAGRWDEAERIATDEILAADAGTRQFTEAWCRWVRGAIRLARADEAAALDDAAKGLEVARNSQDPQVLWPALAFFARACLETGDRGEAEAAADDLLERLQSPLALLPWVWAVDLAWALRALRRDRDFQALLSRKQTKTRWLEAGAAIASGDLVGAAGILGEMGDVSGEAYAWLRAAEQLVEEGRRAEADEQLEQGLAFWRSVGATRYIRQCEELLADSASDT